MMVGLDILLEGVKGFFEKLGIGRARNFLSKFEVFDGLAFVSFLRFCKSTSSESAFTPSSVCMAEGLSLSNLLFPDGDGGFGKSRKFTFLGSLLLLILLFCYLPKVYGAVCEVTMKVSDQSLA